MCDNLRFSLIPQHYYNLNFFKYLSNKKLLLWQAAEPSGPGFCHIEEFTYLSVANKQENSTIDMAKIQIKSEKLTPFGGLFSGRGAI